MLAPVELLRQSTSDLWSPSKSPTPATTHVGLSAVAVAWKVEATGDYNGDGKADIMWRNSSTGANSIWLSGLSTTPQGVAGVTDLNWQVQP